MINHDDELDRALFALPLEPLPEGLRQSILAAVAAVPGPMFRRWEVFGIGVILALTTWLCLITFTGGDHLRSLLAPADFEVARLASDPTTLMWLALGGSTAVWLSLVSLPQRARAGVSRR
jgi:hypothetical protein